MGVVTTFLRGGILGSEGGEAHCLGHGEGVCVFFHDSCSFLLAFRGLKGRFCVVRAYGVGGG